MVVCVGAGVDGCAVVCVGAGVDGCVGAGVCFDTCGEVDAGTWVGEAVPVFRGTTVTLHRSVFLPTLAVMVVFPTFFALTSPFLETVAMRFFLLFHLIFFPPDFFTFNFLVSPCFRVSFVLFSLGFDAAEASVYGSSVRHIAVTSSIDNTSLIVRFIATPVPFFKL